MREKPVSEKTITKYIDFLYSVKENALPYQCKVSLSEISTNFSINKTAPKAIEKLGLIKKISTTKWEWLGDPDVWPDKELALRVLNHLLAMNKKTVHTPIWADYAADIAAITQTLSEIRDNTSETNKSIDRIKSSRANRQKDLPAIASEQIHGETLFSEADQRFGILKAISSGIYGAILGTTTATNFLKDKRYQLINDIIIASTEDLMNKAFNKLPIDEVDKTEIGNCAICRKVIRANQNYSKSLDNDNLYCHAHSGDFVNERHIKK
jgi:hypothetical protein